MSSACVHCGAPAAPTPTGAGPYCCVGCHLAHHLLRGGDRDESEGRALGRLVLAALLAMGVMVFSLALYGIDPVAEGESGEALRGLFRLGAFALSTPVLFLVGVPLLVAVIDLRRFLSADALIVVGAGSAWVASAWATFTEGERVWFDTATMVLVLVALGRWLDARTRERATERLHGLAEERVAPVERLDDEGPRDVRPADLRPGDRVRLRPGDVVPVDGEVLEGASFVDASALTGEERHVRASAGDRVLAGTRLVDGSLVLTVQAAAGERVRDEVERLLARAQSERAGLVRVADRVAAVFLPFVVALALATAVLRGRSHGLEEGLMDALAVLLIACPCALGLATPLAFWAAIASAWERGILVASGEVLERLARTRRVFLDKTGTLTTGRLELASVTPAPDQAGWTRERTLTVAAALEAGSEHPVGRALRAAAPGPVTAAASFRALPGVGVEGVVEGTSYRLARAEGADEDRPGGDGETVVRLTRLTRLTRPTSDGEALATIALRGELRPEARRVVDDLRERGLAVRVLTGDGGAAARALAAALDVEVEHGLLPGDKVARLRADPGGPSDRGARGTLYVGDGLNDAAALAAADVGVSMPRSASVSLEAAPVNLLREDLAALPELLDLARRAVAVARQNLAWAFAFNAVGLWLAATGRLDPVFAAAAMVASGVLVGLNSARLASPRGGSAAGRGGEYALGPSERATLFGVGWSMRPRAYR